jgi:aminoglycoside 6'-N-acetyltransferase
MPVELQGDRIVLRTLVNADIGRVAEIGREPGFAHWWPGLDEADLASKVGEASGTVLAILYEGDVIGIAQFHEEDDPDYRHAGIDVGLATAWQDRGLGTDTVRTLARYLVQERGHHRLVIDPAAGNHRAIRCYEKVGFRPVGVMRLYERSGDGSWHDGLLMDLLASELT